MFRFALSPFCGYYKLQNTIRFGNKALSWKNLPQRLWLLERRIGTPLFGRSYWKHKPAEGPGFLVVYYTVENMTHEPITGSDFKKFKVKDKNGRTYNANTSYIMYTGEGHSIHELPPGLPKKTAAVFEMPLSSFEGDASFTVTIPENGDFKNETRELTFTKTAKATTETNEAKSQGKPKAKSKTGT